MKVKQPIKILYLPGWETENDPRGKGKSLNYFKEGKYVILSVVQRDHSVRQDDQQKLQ